jgi:hypothetical protein
MKRRILILTTLFLIIAIPSGTALAESLYDTVVEAGEEINNDVVLISDNLEIDEGATVDGSVVVVSGNAKIAGTVTGDVVLFSGNLETTETAVIEGDCVLLSGNLTNNAAGISCTNVSSGAPDFIANLDIPGIPAIPNLPELDGVPNVNVHVSEPSFFRNIVESGGSAVMMGILAFVIAYFIPSNISRVQEAVEQKVVVSGTVGLLTAVAVPSLIALLVPVSIILTIVCIGLLGFPIMLALGIGLGAATIFGWVTMGSMFGQRLARWFKMKQQSLPLTAALGTAALTFGIGLLGAIPFVFGEGLLTTALICVGLGATALTHFGTRSYPRLAGEPVIDGGKLTAVLDTLPEDPADLK